MDASGDGIGEVFQVQYRVPRNLNARIATLSPEAVR
jgi:hypothetical protein